jgi:hypothetical protein
MAIGPRRTETNTNGDTMMNYPQAGHVGVGAEQAGMLKQAQALTSQPRASAAADRLEHLVESLDKILTIGHQHVERVAGAVPSPPRDVNYAQNGTSAPPPHSQFGRIEYAIERLKELVHNNAAALIERLGTL